MIQMSPRLVSATRSARRPVARLSSGSTWAPISDRSRCTPRRTTMARSDWRPSTSGFWRIGDTMGMAHHASFCSRFEPAPKRDYLANPPAILLHLPLMSGCLYSRGLKNSGWARLHHPPSDSLAVGPQSPTAIFSDPFDGKPQTMRFRAIKRRVDHEEDLRKADPGSAFVADAGHCC